MKNIEIFSAVPIYDITGKKLNEISLPEKIMPIPARRGGFSENGVYYKGCGIVYRNHLSDRSVNRMSGNEQIIGKTGIVYEQYLACYPNLVRRFGIFTFPHQPIFTDCEGGCGKKEQKLIENQKLFEYSAIEEIVNVIPIGIPEHNIYVYRLKNIKGGIEDTRELIEYVLVNDFNTAWDKNLWDDIYAYGYVKDVADWFSSDDLNHKIGTIYALLNSLYRAAPSLYAQLLLNFFGEYSFEKYLILYYSALIVNKFCHELFEKENIDIRILNTEIYEQLLSILFSGKSCCHLEDEEKYAWVYEYYESVKKKYMEKLRNMLV